MNQKTSDFKSFGEFYPFYLSEHSNPWTRVFHFLGTCGVLYFIARCVQLNSLSPLALAPLFAYGFAWASHFFIEKNRPATFKYPFYSLAGDFRMFWELLTFQIPFNENLRK